MSDEGARGATAPRAGAPRAIAVVPARLGSTRLARKMLLRETGSYLFEHTVRRVVSCSAIERCVLATDSEEILAAAREVDVEALLTSASHQSGTDRVHEALGRLGEREGHPWDVVVNVQGDEVEVEPRALEELVAAFSDPAVEAATLCAPVEPAQHADPNVVKVVRDAAGWALYFSRAPIPTSSHARGPGGAAPRRHVGVYAYRPAALGAFCALTPSPLEVAESLEQLRWLEAGRRMLAVAIERAPEGIDTEAEYAAFVARTRA